MKKITIIRGGQSVPFILANGDSYDSIIKIHPDAGQPPDYKIIDYFSTTINNVNTDHTVDYKGGILAEGLYASICTDRNPAFGGKYICIFNLQFLDKIQTANDLTDEMISLPSLVQNPQHQGQKLISSVLIHPGGISWDYSWGCITILPGDFSNFIKYFELNEKIIVELVRAPGWEAPKFYQIK